MKHENKILGVSLIALGFFLSIDSALLYYYYNYTNILFYYMHPTYELIARFIFGLTMIPIGTLIFMNREMGFKILNLLALAMIIYGVIRFGINLEFWVEEFFAGFLYIIAGAFFLKIVQRNKLKLSQA